MLILEILKIKAKIKCHNVIGIIYSKHPKFQNLMQDLTSFWICQYS